MYLLSCKFYDIHTQITSFSGEVNVQTGSVELGFEDNTKKEKNLVTNIYRLK